MITGMNHTGFVVRDVEASAEFYMNVIGIIANGGKQLNPPVEVSPGRIVSYLQDPDGNWIELIQSAE